MRGFIFLIMPKNYPAFIIDRSRRSEQSNHTDDYVICTDKEVGYIARAYKLNRTQFEVHNQRHDAMPPADAECTFITKNFGEVAVVMEVVELLYPPLVNRPRIKSLLKKGLKAYLYGEVAEIGETNIDKQIAVVAEMKRLALSQFDNLTLNNGEQVAAEIVEQLQAAVESLNLLQQLFHGKTKA